MTQPSDSAAEPTPDPSAARTETERRGPRGRQAVTAGSLLALCALLLVGMVMPVPYAIEQPGPAIDVLGEYQGTKILSISGHEVHPTDGSLMMTTVSVDGGPGYAVTPVEVVAAWFDPTKSVLPRELLFPEAQTQEETSLRNSADMTTSQQDAVAVALEELGVPVTRTVIVAGVLEDGPADGVLEPGDVIVSVAGQARQDAEGYQQLTRSSPAGQEIEMVVRRGGSARTVSVPTERVDGATRMGIVIAPGFEVPVDVTVAVEGVGGPSAGTMFALGIYDELTPGALTGGREIAGTGTMSADGTVGAIGGIRQKMVGAREQGADFFLAPAGNCDQVVGHVPDGLHVVSVATFDDALHATQTIASTGSTAALPTCRK